MNTTRRTAVVLAGLLLSMSAAGCSSESTEDANAAYCQAASAAQAEYAELLSILASPDATVDQVNDQRAAISQANEEAQNKASDLSDTVRSDIDSANKAFEDAVAAIPGDATILEAAGTYVAAVDAWDTAIVEIRDRVGCQ